MNEKTLKYAQEQLKQLRQPAMSGRQYNEGEEQSYVSEKAEFIKEQAEDKTEKYKGMIESFECDFSLAVEQGEKYGLDELQVKIEQGNNKLLSDIELLKELSYGLRSGSLKIIQQPKKGGNPPIEK